MRHLALRRAVARGAAAVAGILLLSAAGGAGVRISQDALLTAIEHGVAPRILDVRTTREYTAGHIFGAVHIPYHRVSRRHADLAAEKTDLIVVYCSHGPRAGLAKLQLWALGYEKIAFLEGQMSGWKRKGLPTRIGQEP